MDEQILGIDTYIFDKHFKSFKKFVEGDHDIQFSSFASHPYTRENESYKSSVRNDACEKLSFQNWTTSDIGTGKILSATIDAIELEDNNLVQWHSRW